MKKYITTFFLSLLCLSLYSQNLAMHQWRTHLAYNNTTKIALLPTKVFAVSDGALYSVDKEDGNKEVYSKINGLSDNNIFNIKYSEQLKVMIIAYANGNIDLFFDDGRIENIPDILHKNMTSEKKISDILFHKEYAYLACSFGIVKINIKKREVADSYFIGPNASALDIKSLVMLGDKFYAVTPSAILSALIEGVNLANFNNWTAMDNVPAGDNVKAVVFNSRMYLLQEDGNVHGWHNGLWQTNVFSSISNIDADEDHFSRIVSNKIYYENTNGVSNSFYLTTLPVMAIVEPPSVWIAASNKGVAKVKPLVSLEFFVPNGPITNSNFKLRHTGSRLLAVPGGRWTTAAKIAGDVMIYENEEWKNIENKQIVEALGVLTTDFVDIAVDPNDETHFFVASFSNGIFEFKNGLPTKNYPVGSTDNLAFEGANKLWFLNPLRSPFLKFLLKDNNSDSYSENALSYTTESLLTSSGIVVDSKNPNYKFAIAARGNNKFYAFNDNGTLAEGDDFPMVAKSQFYDQDGKVFRAEHFMCIAQDEKTGSLWVGTTSGPIVLPSPQNVFKNDYRCQRIKIPRNDGTTAADYMLENDVVSAIAIDGANRKWIGTETSGVYLVSPEGTETIHHFTTQNSPLLNNRITSIAINHRNGEVFFGTLGGIVSFRSDAIEPKKDFKSLHVFPNPVKENYDGPITISDLTDRTSVKITDISGNLVYETVSDGGVAIWNGKRKDGKRVSTGVYLAICTTVDGKQYGIAKILIINK